MNNPNDLNDDAKESVKSIEQNEAHNESMEGLQYSKSSSKLSKDNPDALLDDSDLLSLSKSSTYSQQEKEIVQKEESNIHLSFSNISDHDPKINLNETNEDPNLKDNERNWQNDLSISTNSIKICNKESIKNNELNSYTPSTLCNYYQHSNEVTPIQFESKKYPFNPVNTHQVNLNLIYNNMSNNDDSSIIKSATKKTPSQIKYTKAQCGGCNNSNEGHLGNNNEAIKAKNKNLMISHIDNVQYIPQKNIPIIIFPSSTYSAREFKTQNETMKIIGKNDRDLLEKNVTVYENGLRFGNDGFNRNFMFPGNDNPFIKKTIEQKDINTPIENNTNNNNTPKNQKHILSIKTESTCLNTQTKNNGSNTSSNKNIPLFTTNTIKTNDFLTHIANKTNKKSRTMRAGLQKQEISIENKTISDKTEKRTYSSTKKSVSSSRSQSKNNKSSSNDKGRKFSNDSHYKNIIKKIKSKPAVTFPKETNQNIKPISTLFTPVVNPNTYGKTCKNTKKQKDIQIKPKQTHQKVNTQINLASILSKFNRQPNKKVIEQPKSQSTLCTVLNDTLIHNQTNTNTNDTFSKIILQTQETNITTEPNTNSINNKSKYGSNTTILTIKREPKVIQNFSCYKKKTSYQSHFITRDELEKESERHNEVYFQKPAKKLSQLGKLQGDDDIYIDDDE